MDCFDALIALLHRTNKCDLVIKCEAPQSYCGAYGLWSGGSSHVRVIPNEHEASIERGHA